MDQIQEIEIRFKLVADINEENWLAKQEGESVKLGRGRKFVLKGTRSAGF